MIKVYNECKDKETTLPEPKLQLRVDGKNIYINAVDENGKNLAAIWVVYADGSTLLSRTNI